MSSRVMHRVMHRLGTLFQSLFDVDKQERLKVILLSIAFFLIIGSYTIARELKDSLFVHIVGYKYIPIAKILSMIVLIPIILIYSKLVDSMRKHQLVYLYMSAYGLIGLVIAYFLAHPTIGLANSSLDKFRVFGWLIYFFIEGYPAFIASLFWAYSNSITNPEAAKKNYPLMIAASKIGGICAAAFALWIFKRSAHVSSTALDILNHQILMAVAALALMLVPFVIWYLTKRVSAQALHGYEAAYQAEKTGADPSVRKHGVLESLFSGLILLVRYPYVLGMFGMIFFWEVVNSVFGYERLSVGKTVSSTISGYSQFLFEGMIISHIVGFFIVLFGTRIVIKWLGERKSLILVPVLTGSLMLYYLIAKSASAVVAVFVLIRALNYSFANPLRESLYIPTSRDMRFKSKSWIDAFGAKFAKSAGSSYNVFLQMVPVVLVGQVNAIFFAVIVATWIVTAHLLGRRFEHAVKNNEVIGLE